MRERSARADRYVQGSLVSELSAHEAPLGNLDQAS